MRPCIAWSTVACLAVLVAACAPAGPGASGQPAGAAVPRGPKNLIVALDFEPTAMIPFLDGQKSHELRYAVHQPLTTYNMTGEVIPRLAAEVPSLEAGTWLVRPEGTMQTTYRLRPDVTWHDGAPFTSSDVGFAWTVNADRRLPIPGGRASLVREITRVETPDDRTVVLEWAIPYPFAHALIGHELGPYPRHLLEEAYRLDPQQMVNSPFWTTEWIGLGPYRLDSWDLGSSFTVAAYPGFFLGRPPIDTITVKFILNHDTLLANMMAGSVHGSIWILKYLHVVTGVQELEKLGEKPQAIFQSQTLKSYVVNFAYPAFPELASNARVRQALLQAIDRDAMRQLFNGGRVPRAEFWAAQQDALRHQWAHEVIAKYEDDPRRANQILDEVMPRKGSDGIRLSGSGEPAVIKMRGSNESEDVQALPILKGYWKAVGVDIDYELQGTSGGADRETEFKAFGLRTSPTGMAGLYRSDTYYGPACPTAANRWIGSNQACYQNPELDRLTEALKTAISINEQKPLYQQWARIMSTELPLIPSHHAANATFFAKPVVNVQGDTWLPTETMWNVFEWDINW